MRFRGSKRSIAFLMCLVPMFAGSAHATLGWPPTCGNAAAAGGDWRQFGNQLTGDRTQPQESFLNSERAALLSPAWTFDADKVTGSSNNEITGYPIEADGCVFVGSSTGFQTPGWVFAINADNGETVWRTHLDRGVYSTLAVANGLVYAFVSNVKLANDPQIGGPYVVALNEATGSIVWQTTVDHQIGADAVSSPIVYDGIVWVGVSGTAAEVSNGDRSTFEGNFVLLDANSGSILKKTYTIPPDQWPNGYAGGSEWGTIAVDPETAFGYEGTGNPFNFDSEYATTNAVIKIDLARARDVAGNPVESSFITNPNFGEIVGSYKGTVDQYYPDLANTIPCEEISSITLPVNPLGVDCGRLDLDFGAQPNIFKDSSGRTLIGIGQKSGVYHVIDSKTMKAVWTQVLGVPSPVGGIVGSAAYDGTNLYGPHTIGGYLWSVGKNSGSLNWISPVADAVHWGPPVTLANGILYTVDLKGFLDAYDAATGAPLLHRPMELEADTISNRSTNVSVGPVSVDTGPTTHVDPTFSWGGTTIARNTVYASVGVGLTSTEQPETAMPNGFVIAFRPFINPPPV
ncbi:MAG: outer membrane protein assembly factor BamB family protein [Actinomycetota bacterium]